MNSLVYKAPWGKALRWTSIISVLLIAGVAAAILVTDKNRSSGFVVLLLPALLLGTALFAIRTYTLEPTELLIRRLLWTTRVPLAGLQSAEFVPNAMNRSLRLCGNGGLFSFTGWYRNRSLGNYRAFVTELKNTVVLRFPGRTVVISPENPERFVSEISQFASRV
jgi:hypothetical protein